MACRFRLFLCFLGLAWLGAATTAWSQEEKRSYAPIPFNGDPATLLRQRLIQAQRLHDLIRQYGSLREKLNNHIDMSTLPRLDERSVDLGKPLNEAMQQQLNEAVQRMKLEGKVPADIQVGVKDFKEQAEKYVMSLAGKEKPLQQVTIPKRAGGAVAGPEGQLQDRMSRWTLDMLENAEDTKLGALIQKSPAWKNAITDLKEFIDNPRMKSKSWDLGLDKLSLPGGLDTALEKTWERIRKMEMPALPKIDLSTPKLGLSKSLSKLPVPQRWPISESVWWVGVVLCFGLILWQFWRRTGGRRSAAVGRQLGSWPVYPGQISSVAEFIAAFEYLAALRLGTHVRTWHHRAVADELGREGDERRRAASSLASLYEQARYSPEETSLSGETLAAARHDLCFLAGVALP